MPVNLSYPKPRDIYVKIVPIARTDSSTEKCVLPKDAVITGVFVLQDVAAVTAAATFDLGFTGDTDGLLNDFSMAVTTPVGFVAAGAAAGSAVGTKLDSDKVILSTYTAGSSTAGGTGYVFIHYFVAGAGETLTS